MDGYNIVVSKNKLSASAEFFTYSVSLDEKEDVSGRWEAWSGQLADLSATPNYATLEVVADRCQYVDFTPISSGTTAANAANESNDVDDLLSTLDN